MRPLTPPTAPAVASPDAPRMARSVSFPPLIALGARSLRKSFDKINFLSRFNKSPKSPPDIFVFTISRTPSLALLNMSAVSVFNAFPALNAFLSSCLRISSILNAGMSPVIPLFVRYLSTIPVIPFCNFSILAKGNFSASIFFNTELTSSSLVNV